MDHRIPPKPPHYYTATQGQCRFCGHLIFKSNNALNTRAKWHPACVALYKVLYWPTETRKAVWKRDRGVCAVCSTECPKKGPQGWQMDHIKPLVESQGNIEYWKLPNLQSLCVSCHQKKTSAEASTRAAAKKNQPQQ